MFAHSSPLAGGLSPLACLSSTKSLKTGKGLRETGQRGREEEGNSDGHPGHAPNEAAAQWCRCQRRL